MFFKNQSRMASIARRLRRVEQPQPFVPLEQPQEPLADLAHKLAGEERDHAQPLAAALVPSCSSRRRGLAA